MSTFQKMIKFAVRSFKLWRKVKNLKNVATPAEAECWSLTVTYFSTKYVAVIIKWLILGLNDFVEKFYYWDQIDKF